ncbi:hypothetical protein AALP_AA7G220000 [Arabis alpina]|uniref:Amidase domain-containing protein n=1 Tax=Arabis alpina TaxID=50452 RepID=A0A087GJS2_ARAAL|nr:hypothetical protein AALP_AA7G220000 [Arabis alpina]
MVGLKAHLRKLESYLCLENDEVKMIGIWGPAGIGAIKEWLHDQRVLIVLDDVDDREQLEVLAKDISWFGAGSRIIVTTEDTQILKAHGIGIHDIYHVDFPSMEEALEILCRSAFKQSFVPDGFEELAKKVVEFCGNLPLGLCVVGSSLREQDKHEWEFQLSRIKTTVDRKIENILRMGYDKLLKQDQDLFLHIACFFNNDDVNSVTSLLADSELDVGNGLKILAEKSLVHTNVNIRMHYLLQKLGRQIVREQSDEPGERKFLGEVEEIRHVLENETGTASVTGISLDTSKIRNGHKVSVELFRTEVDDFLRIHKSWLGKEAPLQIPEDMEDLSQVRLLHWDFYPRKSLPSRFKPDRLVELHMPRSNLKKLWGGIQPLPNLKSIDLCYSYRCHEVDVTISQITFEFGCEGKFGTEGSCDDKIIECGVEILTEEAEGSSSSQVDNFETGSSISEVDNFEIESRSEVDYESGGNNHNNTDGDGDEDYEAEDFNYSQDENIKTSKHTDQFPQFLFVDDVILGSQGTVSSVLIKEALPHIFPFKKALLIQYGSTIKPTSTFSFQETTIKDIRLAFNEKKLTSKQLVEFYLQSISKLNPIINAVIETNPDALIQAEIADRERNFKDITQLPFLHGAPVLLKDSISTKDKLNTTAGSFALLGSVVARDAGVVKKLREAGAVILGKASLSEWDSFRSYFIPNGWSARGLQGKNPYVLSVDPSGSSSGSPVSVAANLVSVSLGTETGGSILSPASRNSVVGIKPSVGLTSRAGLVPISSRQDSIGPICRTVSDSVHVLDAIWVMIHGTRPGRLRRKEAALQKMEELSRNGIEKLMKKKKLDAIVTVGSMLSSVLAIGGYPGINVPAGYNSEGVPFGISFGGLRFSEPKLIEIAYGFEQAALIRKPPKFKA